MVRLTVAIEAAIEAANSISRDLHNTADFLAHIIRGLRTEVVAAITIIKTPIEEVAKARTSHQVTRIRRGHLLHILNSLP